MSEKQQMQEEPKAVEKEKKSNTEGAVEDGTGGTKGTGDRSWPPKK